MASFVDGRVDREQHMQQLRQLQETLVPGTVTAPEFHFPNLAHTSRRLIHQGDLEWHTVNRCVRSALNHPHSPTSILNVTPPLPLPLL